MNEELIVTNEGKLMIDGKVATNEQLSNYFDFAKYTDAKDQRYVEGILKSNTVTVNGTKYSSIVDNNGYLVSEDGQSKLSPSKAKEIFGEKGYNALVAKKTKNITVDDNGVTVNDGNSEGFKIDDGTIEQNNTDNQNSEAPEETKPEEQQEETKEEEKEEEKKEEEKKEENKEEQKEEQKNNDDTPKSGNSSSGGHSTSGGGHSSSGGGYTPSPSYSSDTSSESPTISPGDETTEEESTEKTEDSSDKKEEKEDSIIKTKTGGKEKIVVDFDALNGLKDDLKTCGTEIEEQFTTYKTNINSVSSSGAWSGEDADAYITAKNKYATSAETITETFNNFTSYLEKCIDQYQALENELSAKFG